MTTTQKRGPGAPTGNGNRRLPEGVAPKRGEAVKFSMPYGDWQKFKAACDLSEGHSLSDEAYREKWRSLATSAAAVFIEANHGLVDPEERML